ncbi:hypothetical protein EV401DRAFT_817809 [Pisolithus croceorrhizus]|nr:hypothetical protein EV401DRAFT_817809 [Pisolithus croceorrhizus]
MRRSLFGGGRQITTAESDPRPEIELRLLRRRCQVLGRFRARRRYADERQRLEGEIKLIRQTLGVDLLEHIMTTFYNAPREDESPEATRKTTRHSFHGRRYKGASSDARCNREHVRTTGTGGRRHRKDPVALVVWDLRRSRRTITQGRKLHSERRGHEGFTANLDGQPPLNRAK